MDFPLCPVQNPSLSRLAGGLASGIFPLGSTDNSRAFPFRRALQVLLVILCCVSCLAAEYRALSSFSLPADPGSSATDQHFSPSSANFRASHAREVALLKQAPGRAESQHSDSRHKEKMHKRGSRSSVAFRFLVSSPVGAVLFFSQTLTAPPPSHVLHGCDPSAPLTPPPNAFRLPA